MKLFTNLSTHTLLLALIAGLVTFSACNNPASSEEEEHQNAVGAVLKTNGQEIVRIEQGNVTGQIEVTAGEETTLISIYFLADDGDEFQPDEPDYSLKWKDIDTTVADVEQHSEDGKWGFHIHGEAQGNTSVVLQLWHDGEDHSDFNSPSIPIVVN